MKVKSIKYYFMLFFFFIMSLGKDSKLNCQSLDSIHTEIHITIPDYLKSELPNTKKSKLKIGIDSFYENGKEHFVYFIRLLFNNVQINKLYKDVNRYHIVIPEIMFRGIEPVEISSFQFETNFQIPDEFFKLDFLSPSNFVRCLGNNYYLLKEDFSVLIQNNLNSLNLSDFDASKITVKCMGMKGSVLVFDFKQIETNSNQRTKDADEVIADHPSSKNYFESISKIIFEFKSEKYFETFRNLEFKNCRDSILYPDYPNKHKLVVFDSLHIDNQECSILLKIIRNESLNAPFELSENSEIKEFIDSKGILVLKEDWLIKNKIISDKSSKELRLNYLDKIISDEIKNSFQLPDKSILLESGKRYTDDEIEAIKRVLKKNKKLERFNYNFELLEDENVVEISLENVMLKFKISDSDKAWVQMSDRIKELRIIYPDQGNETVIAKIDFQTKIFTIPMDKKIEYQLLMSSPPKRYKYENTTKMDNGEEVKYSKRGRLSFENVNGENEITIFPKLKLRKVVRIIFFDCNDSRNTDQIIEIIDSVKMDFDSNRIAGFSLMLAYSADDINIINSWDKDYEHELSPHITNSKENKMLLRTINNPYAIPINQVFETITKKYSLISEQKELKRYGTEEKIYLTDKTLVGIPVDERSNTKYRNILEYKKN